MAAAVEDLLGDKLNGLVLPGDVIFKITPELKAKIGPGLRQDNDVIVAVKAGLLCFKKPSTVWIESSHKRYVAVQEEAVLGVVKERQGEIYKVDIGTSSPAILPLLAFEGATKKNRPNLRVGSLVYARLLLANKDMEPELVCYSIDQKAEGYGELEGGFLFSASLGLVRRLLNPECAILTALGHHIAFEICIGLNGRVWIKTPSEKQTILVANAIKNSEFLSAKQIQSLVDQLVQQL